ncbi:MAG: HipA N-terminal domain-containing protein [Chthoniobacterales bacterium]|nr:HipA N-terminal domain-containing protein [Chthoniobacterales bacterium]
MKRRGLVFCKGIFAGELEETEQRDFIFTYDPAYLANPSARSVSLTLPLRAKPYTANRLFSFFSGLLAEGVLKELQCQDLKIDESDAFGRLLKTAGSETIGDVTVRQEEVA